MRTLIEDFNPTRLSQKNDEFHYLNRIALLPGHKSAYIPIPKIRDYSLNPGHEEGKHKAIVFRSALGVNQENYQWLIDKIREGLSESEAMEEESISFGKRYLVDLVDP